MQKLHIVQSFVDLSNLLLSYVLLKWCKSFVIIYFNLFLIKKSVV